MPARYSLGLIDPPVAQLLHCPVIILGNGRLVVDFLALGRQHHYLQLRALWAVSQGCDGHANGARVGKGLLMDTFLPFQRTIFMVFVISSLVQHGETSITVVIFVTLPINDRLRGRRFSQLA